MLKVTNKSGGQLVCDLASGETLRLDNNASTDIKDADLTKHLERLSAKGLILLQSVSSKVSKSAAKEEKEVK